MRMDVRINPALREEYYRRGWWTERNLLDCWDEAVRLYGEREYVSDDKGCRMTYRETDEQAARLAAWLRAQGVGPGDTVALMLPNWAEYCAAYVACLKAGVTIHLLYRGTAPDELADLLTRSEAAALFCPTFFYKTDYEALLDPLRRQVKTLRCIALFDALRAPKTAYPAYSQIQREFAPLQTPAPHADADGVAVLMNTSGTTSRPKIVMLTHNNILFSERMFNCELGVMQEDVMFMPSPLHHATGFHHGLIAPMLAGARVVLQQRFEYAQALEMIRRERCTYSMGSTPFIYDMLGALEKENGRLPSLRFYLCGGAHVPQSIVERGKALDIPVCEVYGSTESVPHVFVRPDEASVLDGASSGRPIEGVEVRVVDEAGRDVPPGVQGEELSRGPNVFVGYLKNPEATRAAIGEDGFYASGDLCVADGKGNIKITGRKKEILVRGGENLSLHRIEDALEGCGAVADCAVSGWPDERLGERICAYIVPRSGAEGLTLSELQADLRARGVPKYLWPERIELREKIPRTPTGKVQRYLLR